MSDQSEDKARLVQQGTGQMFPITESEAVTIGRKESNTVVIKDDRKVSREHAQISTWEGHYFIEDLGSSNGTFLNDQRIAKPKSLTDGDALQIGDTVFIIQLPHSAHKETVISVRPPPVASPQLKKSDTDRASTQPAEDDTLNVGTGLDYEILHKRDFPLLKVRLRSQERLKAESGAMVSMTPAIDVLGKVDGGILQGIGRVLAGEKFFFQKLVAERGPGEVLLAHTVPGMIRAIELDGSQNYILQKDGFFAGSEGIEISTEVQSLSKGLFSGEGFFVLKVSGQGTLFVSSYGAIHTVDIPADEEYIVDNAHLVAWPEEVSYNIEKASKGWLSSFTSGEGWVCRFKGPGQVLIQTRNPQAFGNWVKQFSSDGDSGGVEILGDILG